MIILWLVNTVFSQIANDVSYADTGREVWLHFEEKFSEENGPRIDK